MSGGARGERDAASAATSGERSGSLARVVPVALALGLLAGGLSATLDALPASAAAVTGVTFSGSSMAAGATHTTWTISFTPATALTDADTISVTFAAGFALPASPAVTLGAGFTCTTPPAIGSTSGQTVTINLTGSVCTFGSSETLTIKGITNPAVAGSYPNTSFSVATSVDSAGSPTANVVITGVEDVTFSGSSMLGGATNTTWTIGFNVGRGSSGPDTIVVVFASGFVIPASPAVALGAAFTGCTGSTTASASATTVTISVGAGCTLAADASATLTIGDITNPPAGSYANSLFSVTADTETAGSPAANVVIIAAPDGSGTISASPTSVPVGSSGDTFVFTYTAAPGGLNSGELELTVPTGWSTPSITPSAPGYVTSTCGVVSVGTFTIIVSNVTLAAGASCTITYGSRAGGGPGVFAPSAPNTYLFTTVEMSTVTGALTDLASSPGLSTGTPSLTQIYGTDGIGTSIAISQAEFPKSGSAKAVVLARSTFSDALAGGPLAAQEGGPLLITPGASISASLDPRVLTEIERVLPLGGTVYILGGDLALSPDIDTTLEGLGFNVVREAGVDEFATAVDIAEQLGNPTTIFEATGLDFHDALSAVPATIEAHGAILLTNGCVPVPRDIRLHPRAPRRHSVRHRRTGCCSRGRHRRDRDLMVRTNSTHRPRWRATSSPMRLFSARRRRLSSPTHSPVGSSWRLVVASDRSFL